MKIAIAMFGIPREATRTMPTLREQLIRPACEVGETRIFCHLFEQERVDNPRQNEFGVLAAADYDQFKDFELALEPAGACLPDTPFEAVQAFGDWYENGFKTIANSMHQLHSLRRVTDMVTAWEPDVVVFARPDLIYHDPLRKALLVDASVHADRCYVPAWQWWRGYNDRFSICGRDAYRTVGYRIDEVVESCRADGLPFAGEHLLHHVLRTGRSGVRTTKLRASRARLGGTTHKECFAPLRETSKRHWPEMLWRNWLSAETNRKNSNLA